VRSWAVNHGLGKIPCSSLGVGSTASARARCATGGVKLFSSPLCFSTKRHSKLSMLLHHADIPLYSADAAPAHLIHVEGETRQRPQAAELPERCSGESEGLDGALCRLLAVEACSSSSQPATACGWGSGGRIWQPPPSTQWR
jgi:hypothetical protein